VLDWAYWLQYWYIFPVAMAICLIVCTVGIEGAVLFVPFFTLVFPLLIAPLEPVQAVAIGLITEVFGFASALIAWWRAGLIDTKIAQRSAYLSIPFALAGGFVSYYLPSVALLLLVGLAMIVIGLPLWQFQMEAALDDPPSAGELHRSAVVEQHRVRDRWGREYLYAYREDMRRWAVVGFGGLFEGLVGFGIGVLGVADLILRKIPVRVAIGTSHAIIAVTAVAAAVPHVYEVAVAGREIPWNVLAMTIPAVTIMAQASSYVAGYLPQELMKKLIAALLMVLGFVTIGRGVYLIIR
jgi:uncharacterized membrane protein YfcA